jgi:hypothetical protein
MNTAYPGLLTGVVTGAGVDISETLEEVVIDSCNFSNNLARNIIPDMVFGFSGCGLAIAANATGNAVITNCVFSANNSIVGIFITPACALLVHTKSVQINNCTIKDHIIEDLLVNQISNGQLCFSKAVEMWRN